MEVAGQALEALRVARKRTKKELTRLDAAIRTFQKLTVATPAAQTRRAVKPRRKMSAAARGKIAAAQRARWAKTRKQESSA